MILLWTNVTGSKHQVVGVHNAPLDENLGLGKTQKELEAEGAVFVDSIPEPENNGKGHTHYINLTTKEQWYEYYDLPLTDGERIEQLAAENAELRLATIDMADIIAHQDARLDEQQIALLDLANTLAEVFK